MQLGDWRFGAVVFVDQKLKILKIYLMKARVKISIPKFQTSDNDIGGKKRSPKKSDKRRQQLLSYQTPNLKSVLSSTSDLQSEMADSQRIDHNNLPYAWRGHSTNHAAGEKSDASLRKSAQKAHVRPLKGGSRTRLHPSSSAPVLDQTMSSTKYEEDETSKVESPSPSTSPVPKLNNTTLKLPPPPIGADEPVPTWWDQPSFTRLDQSRMPLEAFDDSSLEYKNGTPAEWLETCRTGRVKYYADGVWRWRRVTINSYDADTNRYNVTFDGPAEVKKRLTKNVRRLDLLFTDEDQTLFEQRRQAAEQYREDFKSALRLRSYMDQVYIKERADLNTIQDTTMKSIVDAAHGGSRRAKKSQELIALKRKQEEEDGEKISGPTLSETLVRVVQERYNRAQGKSSLKYQLKNNNALRQEFIESRLPFHLLPENQAVTPIPFSGTIGEFIPRPLYVTQQLGGRKKSNSDKRGSGSSSGSPGKDGIYTQLARSPRMSRTSSFNSASMFHLDTETHVGGILTFVGRIVQVMDGLFPGSPVMMNLIQIMNTRWWDKCSMMTYVADHQTLLDYIPVTSDIRKELPCAMNDLIFMQQEASKRAAKELKEEWRDRVLAASLDAFEEFPEIDKFAIETLEQFEDSKVSTKVF